MDSGLLEQLRLLTMMPQEPRVSFKVQEHQVHTRTLASVSVCLQRLLWLDRASKVPERHQVHVGANRCFAG